MHARPVSANELDQRVTLLTPSSTQDAVGQTVSGWTDGAAVWARARPTTSREAFRDGAVMALDTIAFAIRYRAGLSATNAVRWRGKVYQLLAEPVNVDGGNHTLELICGTKPE